MVPVPKQRTTAPRIASLIPSATEIVGILGLTGHLVGRSHECDHPPGIGHLPALTSPAFKTSGSVRDIDDGVRGLLERALSIYRLDVDKLQEIRPIITQDQCEVCALSLGEVEEAVCRLEGVDAKVISLHPMRMAHVWGDIVAVAHALGVDGTAAAKACAVRVDTIARQLADLPDGARKRVACLEWPDPVYTAGSWLPDIVTAAGGIEVTGQVGIHAHRIDWPEVIAGEAYVVNANSFFSRPGPRLVGSVEVLAEILHPDRFDFGHKGRDWARFDN